MPCDGILGSLNIPNFPCTTQTGEAGTWSADCECVPDAPACQGCFTATQATGGGLLIPFTADLTNCTTGGTAPYAYVWTVESAVVSNQGAPQITFPGTGIYITCLNVTTSDGGTCTDCDTLFVDANGIISPYVEGCHACLEVVPATNGPAGPAIPWTVDLINCSTGSGPYIYNVSWGDGMDGLPGTHVYSFPGTYTVCLSMSASACDNTACTTVVVGEDGTINPVTTDPCEAEFFVMQAYEWVEEPGNPNGGGGEPIPNELWVWNLSGGGTGLFQFTWDFGDGTTSTEAFPSHTYAEGEWELCLTVMDNAGCSDEFCHMVSVDGDGILNGLSGGTGNRNTFTIRVMDPFTTGIAEEGVIVPLATWPNPVIDVLNIALNTPPLGTPRVSIIDLGGRTIMDATSISNVSSGRLAVPVGNLSDGLYIIRVSDNERTMSSRFAKGH